MNASSFIIQYFIEMDMLTISSEANHHYQEEKEKLLNKVLQHLHQIDFKF